jgi:quinone-modifying oxidoreductase subunit QmoC
VKKITKHLDTFLVPDYFSDRYMEQSLGVSFGLYCCKENQMANAQRIDPDLKFIREIGTAGGDNLKKCYQCATCSVVCNLSPDNKPFPRKEMIMAQWGRSEELMRDPDVWMCYQCNDCSTYCPRNARPGDVLAAIRSYTYKSYSFPSFMGKALAYPAMLPVLLLIPALILLACIFMFAPRTADGEFLFMTGGVIDFNVFLPHSSVDALFVTGNILIFIFAAVGFLRFWKMMRKGAEPKQISFLRALAGTLKDILSHAHFFECDANQQRAQGHILLLIGFIGAMITTGMVFIFIFIPHYLGLLGLEQFHSVFALPLNLPHPVKFLGAISGLLLVLGGSLLIFRRWVNKDQVGASGYTDNLFLYMLFLVGLTGMLSWLMRVAGSPMLAYSSYFIHLLVVWFLLWYMPYSKFAHMIYRTLALVHARMMGRTARRTKHEIWEKQGYHLLAGADKNKVWS